MWPKDQEGTSTLLFATCLPDGYLRPLPHSGIWVPMGVMTLIWVPWNQEARAALHLAGKDQFCRVCGRSAGRWLVWTAEEKVSQSRVPLCAKCRTTYAFSCNKFPFMLFPKYVTVMSAPK